MRAHPEDRLIGGARFALLAPALLSLVAGAWSGLARVGVELPPPGTTALVAHGALMVGGVLGTLIGLERAVALGRRWALGAPLASGTGAVLAVAGAELRWVVAAFVLASLVFMATNVAVTLRQVAAHALVMLLGAVLWATGNLAWAFGVPVSSLVLSWAAFLVLTIAGERMELSRMLAPPGSALRLFFAVALALGAGAALALFRPGLGARVVGVSLLLAVGWLLRYDVARRTLRLPGLPRYAAASVLSGYVWLTVSGSMLVWRGLPAAGPLYDAVLHALFLGFVFSMVFGHAPIILPAVLRVELPYARLLYLPLTMLHGSVALRVAADLLGLGLLRRWAATFNVATLLGFALCVVLVKLHANPGQERTPRQRAGWARP